MSEIKTGGPAFPSPLDTHKLDDKGMTLLDHFAQTQMPLYFGKLSNRFDTVKPIEYIQAANSCYRDASAMLKAREATT
jgi:hypothetical protein